jgi:thiosulfate/3-mercaptopyruvate sulfurtransferase
MNRSLDYARDDGKMIMSDCPEAGGISATIDLFLLHQLGFDDITLYDASMGE